MRRGPGPGHGLPNYAKKDDEELRRYGIPDMIILVQGHRLFVHSTIMKLNSTVIYDLLLHPDPMLGKQVHMMSSPGRPRTRAGVVALLNAIYPAQVSPPAELFPEVVDIAKEYRMELLLDRLKLGVVKNCDFELLEAAERNNAWPPEVVLEAFAEFSVDELKALPGYSSLQATTKVELARRRVALLERELAKKALEPCRTVHPQLFRKCPPELARSDEERGDRLEDRLEQEVAAAMGNLRPQALPPWLGGTSVSLSSSNGGHHSRGPTGSAASMLRDPAGGRPRSAPLGNSSRGRGR